MVRTYCNTQTQYWVQAYAYSDNIWEIEVADADGEPVDLTGTEITARLKADLRDGDRDAVGELECEITDAPNGVLICRLPAGTVPPGSYYCSVRVEWPAGGHSALAGAVVTVAELVLVVKAEATREGR